MIGINSYMKTFYPTYLYIKTHNITGLKYFGKTTKDPYQYQGSGKRWLAHLKKHGNDVSTEVFGYYDSEQECLCAATAFSKENNIVESVEWANMIDENGLDGGATGRTNYTPMSDDAKRKLSESKKGQKPWNTGLQGQNPGNKHPRTEEQKQKISKSLTGRKRSPESVAKTADALRGRNRPNATEWLKNKIVSDDTKKKMSAARKGKVVSEETKNKIRKARKLQVITQETKDKLKGKIVCINQFGVIMKIEKDLFYSQIGEPINQEWVFHNSTEGKRRKESRN
jgi:hypothetical protein